MYPRRQLWVSSTIKKGKAPEERKSFKDEHDASSKFLRFFGADVFSLLQIPARDAVGYILPPWARLALFPRTLIF